MANTFLFDDIEEEEVSTTPTLPTETGTSSLFNDIEEEPIYVPQESTLPSQEGGAFAFDDVETNEEDFDMSIDAAVEEPIIPQDDSVTTMLSEESINARVEELYQAEVDRLDALV